MIRMLAAAGVLIMTAFVTACSGSGKDKPAPVVHPVSVFFGTNRDVRDPINPAKHYGLNRGGLDYGIAGLTVTQPDGKARLESIDPQPRNVFLEKLARAVSEAERPEIFVFIHGYNRSFNQVSKQVAAFTDNTGFPGVPMLWSWPSSRTPQGYLEDETNMRWSQPHALRFLRDVMSVAGVERVHLIGHSLGGRALVELTVQRLIPEGDALDRIGQYVLLAPDIDTAIFRRDHAPVLAEAGLAVTLYTSANDKAMASARTLRSYPRAGDSKTGVLVAPGIETIDVTAANRSILGHSYFDESQWVAEDLGSLISEGKRASERQRLLKVEDEEGVYWRLLVDE